MEVGDKVIYTQNQSIFESRLLKRPHGVITRMRNVRDLGRNIAIVDCTWTMPDGTSFNWNVKENHVKQIK
jgi:hypothetical protein